MAQFIITDNAVRGECDMSMREASAFALMYKAFATVVVQQEHNEILMRDALTTILLHSGIESTDIDDELIARVNVRANNAFVALNEWIDTLAVTDGSD